MSLLFHLHQLGKSVESRKRLSREVSELSDHVDDLSSELATSNLKIGELRALNESLTLRMSENEHAPTVEEMRQSVSRLMTQIDSCLMSYCIS